MKRYLLLIICLIILIPVIVNAESGYLYDVLKNEAEAEYLIESAPFEGQFSLSEQFFNMDSEIL